MMWGALTSCSACDRRLPSLHSWASRAEFPDSASAMYERATHALSTTLVSWEMIDVERR